MLFDERMVVRFNEVLYHWWQLEYVTIIVFVLALCAIFLSNTSHATARLFGTFTEFGALLYFALLFWMSAGWPADPVFSAVLVWVILIVAGLQAVMMALTLIFQYVRKE